MDTDLIRFKKAAGSFKLNGRLFLDPNIQVTHSHAPGRLDVMGGIADYSGSLVLEMPIAEATFAAIQIHPAPTLEIISLRENGQAKFVMPLTDFGPADSPISYADGGAYFKQSAEDHWAAYVAGVFLVLMREKGVHFERGAKILIRSDVPEGKGVSSSAALEVATMQTVANAYQLKLDPIETATLCQIVENKVAGAPCGIMDQMTVVNGRPGKLMALLCQPATIQGYVDIPADLAFWGIDSGIRHAVSGADYGSVRVGAFMGLKILQSLGFEGGYLANLSPSEFTQTYQNQLPERLFGGDFLERFGELPDAVTTVKTEKLYAVRQPTAHPIYEHFRVNTFAQLLKNGGLENGKLLGELMFQSHASYSACGLGSDGTDLLVELVRQAGTDCGLFGAKITGGGSGGTVAILGAADAEAQVMQVAKTYEEQAGHRPTIFSGSSAGASVFS